MATPTKRPAEAYDRVVLEAKGDLKVRNEHWDPETLEFFFEAEEAATDVDLLNYAYQKVVKACTNKPSKKLDIVWLALDLPGKLVEYKQKLTVGNEEYILPGGVMVERHSGLNSKVDALVSPRTAALHVPPAEWFKDVETYSIGPEHEPEDPLKFPLVYYKPLYGEKGEQIGSISSKGKRHAKTRC